jgi:hypothetical protein
VGYDADMIRYALKCENAHHFDSWFKSADAFESLNASGMVSCPICGSEKVEKAIMAPRLTTARGKENTPAAPPAKGDLSKPASEVEAKLAAMRKHVEENSDYVGMSFAAEARKMHDGEIPRRAIYGEAKPQEAKKLLEEGVPVAPLPFMPQRKTN